MTEHELDRRILAQFRAMFSDRGFLEKTHAELIRDREGRQLATHAGQPDLVGCLDGKYICFEDKVCPNRPTPQQWAYLQRVIQCGGYAGMFVLRQGTVMFIQPEYIESRPVEQFSWADHTRWVLLGTEHSFLIPWAFHAFKFNREK